MGLFKKNQNQVKQGQGPGLWGLSIQGDVWVHRVEHIILRVVSLAFSLGSAHAIRWFFSPLDEADHLQPFITWAIAISFGVLGFFVSRGLAYRMMVKESILLYVPVCVVVELVEIFCNFAMAAAVIERAVWLQNVTPMLQGFLTVVVYIVLSCIPLVSVLLAVVDMDMDRKRMREKVAPKQAPTSIPTHGMGIQPQAAYPQGIRPMVPAQKPVSGIPTQQMGTVPAGRS
ncbi:hypothetical protein EI42_06136 [Thermosporothrix hazakensis]|jgi:hypothetical protein|uniref:Uncharacterized protein n=1 Tax=Thermosporothrix hazakensis TaxID=644383 RepID=A0A326U270_THEHA|nr:hypothetical protein [Thermosporothrix hazakensis]PZW19323.1 hypothetical protein EI42_06136 [Thermosporothrix hazakensis]GCE48238.1 hypothetical protein KTH_31070 [Thermosporothrix hazakensis]